MSSPPPPPFSPYSSTPPSFPLTTSSLPRKRPSTSSTVPSNLNPAKRRKPSTSSSVHPLRQSSFPPPDGPVSPSGGHVRASYSPSVDGARSTTSTQRGGGKNRKKEGRSTRAPSTVIDTTSKNTTTTRTPARDTDQNETSPPAADNDDDEADADAADEAAALFTNARENLDIEATTNRANMLMLHAAFSQDQQMRWEEWRRGKLEPKAIKRLANQTLSQSVGGGIVQAINAAAKMFVGELVEGARAVQGEWIGAGREGKREKGVASEERIRMDNLNGIVKVEEGTLMGGNGTELLEDATPTQQLPYQPLVQEIDRGPLTPDHLREAVRRYKKDREGGSAGFVGRSLHGVERTAARTGGKRLFR